MKKCLVITVLLLLVSLPGFTSANSGSHVQPSRWSQFHRSQTSHKKPASQVVAHPHGIPVTSPSYRQELTHWKPTPEAAVGKLGRPHKLSNSSALVSFVTAARTPLGGTDDDNTAAVMGDFNGDGKMDVAKVVSNVVSSTTTYQVAVLLGNGDGTFQTAVVTATDGNADDPIVVGDLTGSGTDDIVQVHPTGDNCDGPPPAGRRLHAMTLPDCGSSIDVMLSNGSGGFAAPVNYSVTGASLQGGLLTDVNGDGKLDVLVFDDSSPANVIEMLGNGDGTFGEPITLGHLTGTTPRDMFFADFNGDGKIDFAGEAESGQILVTLATGAGAYANAPVALTTQDGGYYACGGSTAGNLTSASVPEIISFNCEQNTVTVYVNNGDGSFATGLYYDNSANQNQWMINGAVGDMNGDGKNDVIAINADTSEISVLLGNGDGTLAAQPLRYAVGGYAWAPPLVAAWNANGPMSVVESDDAFNLVYLQGYGEGTFKAAPTYNLPNTFGQDTWTYSVVSADFNGDGIPDVAVGEYGNNGSTGITIYLGNGDGTFKTGVSYGASNSMGALGVADFNGDGILDIAAIDWNSQRVEIFLGNGDGTFTIGGEFATDTNEGPGPADLVIGDFNKDGKPDIAIANYDGNIGVLLGHGDGTFAAPVSYPAGEGLEPEAIVAGDVNGDGFLDLAISCYSDGPAVVIMLGKTDSSGTFEAPTATNIDGEPNDIAIGDLNNDGKLDLAVTENEGITYRGQVEILLGNGNGTFAAPVAYQASPFGGATGDSYPASILMVDTTGSGNLDLVYMNGDYGALAVAAGNGDGTVATPVEFPITEDTWGLAAVDLTNDGFKDLVIGDDDAGGFTVLINGNGSAANPNYSINAPTPSASVTAGSSATYTVNLAGTNGYTGTVTFACGNLPTGATCSFSPSSVSAQGAVPISTTVTITTTGSAAASLVRPSCPGSTTGSTMLMASLSGFGLFGIFLVGSGKKRSAHVLGGMMVLLMLCTLVACGGASSGGKGATPAGNYLVTVTSTGTGTGAPTHALSLTLIVQ